MKLLLISSVGALVLGVLLGRYFVPSAVVPRAERQGSVASGAARVSPGSVSSLPIASLKEIPALFEATNSGGFQRLLQEALEHPDTSYGTTLTYLLTTEWAKKDPAAARDYLFSEIKDRHERDHLLGIVFQANGEHPEESLAWIRANVPDRDRANQLAASVYAGMASEDPVGAMAMIEGTATGHELTAAREAVIGEWAARDIKGAFAWIQTQDYSGELYSNYSSLMYSYIEQDPIEAAKVITSMTSGDLKTNLAEHYTRELAETDPKKALEWANQLQDPEARERSLAQSISILGMEQPDEALTLVASQSDPQFRDRLGMELADHLARTKPETLPARLEKFPPEQQPMIVTNLAQSWAMADLPAAQEWISQMPEGELRNQAALASSEMLAHRSPAAAFSLATLHSDPEVGPNLVRSVSEQWYQVNPTAATEAISANPGLSEAQKGELLSHLNTLNPVDIVVPR